ncbi:MAG TPA: MlaD family protein [Solirubrobacterales bacterium]|nr:MlaD family protein [Solirubrobacterales bacterium]
MNKQAPSTGQLLVIVGFALSCFGILLFLWITFGGPTPFKAQPYEIKVPFKEATQLAEQSDVRISGVSVGKVQKIDLAENGEDALAIIYLDNKYGPIPRGTRAILRTKTLLGETYVELTPGDSEGPDLPDGATLSSGQIAESVQLDEIFRTFDARTRAAFQEWQRQAAIAIQGQGESFSMAFAELEPTFQQFDRLFRVLDTQRLALRQLFSNGAVTFRALRGREGQLADLIESSNAVFRTTAARDRDIEALFRAFPTFLDESRLTFDRLRDFAVNTDPLMRQLVPAAEELSPTLISLSRFAPEAKGFFKGFAPVIRRADTGFPAARRFFRDDFPVLLRALDPFLRNLNPVLTGLGLYKNELTAAMANVAAATNARVVGGVKFLRAMGPFNPESLAVFQRRLTSNRNNAYPQPLTSRRLSRGLLSFDTRQCGAGIAARLDPETPKDPDFQGRIEPKKDPDPAKEQESRLKRAEELFGLLKHYAMADQDSTATVPAPGCSQQAPFAPIYGSEPPTIYQHTYEQGG